MKIKKEKAYKVLATQYELSNSKAKELCDKGLVYMHGKRVKIARALIDIDTSLTIQEQAQASVIFEDSDIIAINKPAFMDSYELEKKFSPYVLLHRLDKETSGVLLMSKNEEMRLKCIKEFKKLNVYKEYVAITHGLCSETIEISDLIESKKFKNTIKSFVSKEGKPAISVVSPISYIGKKSKVKIVITHGRTHQIRVHLAYHSLPIVGDFTYGFNSKAQRMLLHAKKIKILNYEFEANEPREFELH